MRDAYRLTFSFEYAPAQPLRRTFPSARPISDGLPARIDPDTGKFALQLPADLYTDPITIDADRIPPAVVTVIVTDNSTNPPGIGKFRAILGIRHAQTAP